MSRLYDVFLSNWLIVIFGCVLLSCGISLLFWNEGRAVHTIISLNEALNDAVAVVPNDEIEEIYEGRIVHLTGLIYVGEPLTEPDYNIQVLAVSLRRQVQMYQWVEETVEYNYGSSVASIDADSKTYYYSMEWRDKLIDSRSFYFQAGHRNPDKFPIKSETQVADNVYIGKFELGQEIKSKFNQFVELTSDTRPDDPSIKLHLGFYYHSNDVFNPEIGDVRLLFSFAGMEGEMYTIVGKIHKNKIVPYRASNNGEVLLVYQGEFSLAEVFKREHHAQRLTTWSFRLMGWILLFFGTTCTASLIYVIISQIHLLSSMAPDPEHPVWTNILLSISLTLVVISIAWILHRPLVATGMLFAAASPFLYCARSVMQYQRVD